MKKIRLFLFITVAITLCFGFFIQGKGKKVDEALYLSEVAPDAVFDKKKGDHYRSPSGIVAFNTYDVAASIKGYAGPIKLLIVLTPDGNISGIKILEHRETPNYVHAMETPEFMNQFIGKGIGDAFDVDIDIDGISRATVSVKALAETVRESSRTIASGVMGLKVSGAKAKNGINLRWAAYLVLLLSALGAYFVFRVKPKAHLDKVRDLMLVLGFIVVGFWLSSPFSILHVLNLLMLGYSTDALWIAVVGGTLLSVAVAGRFYCGWLCPFGAISEFIGRLPVRKWEVPVDMDDRFRNVKFILLGAVSVVVLLTWNAGFGNFETYVTLFSFHGNAFTWAIVAVGVIANLRIKRFWCRYFCPVAALTGALSRKDAGYVSRGDCPMANKPMPLISECIRCGRCYVKRSSL